MTTKENFIKRYNDVKQDVIEAMDKALERAIGNEVINLKNCADDYSDVYPLIGAVLQRETHGCLEGGSYEHKIRQQKRQAAAYRQDYRIWHDYAGDYKSHGEV